jgi:hypothetical protein
MCIEVNNLIPIPEMENADLKEVYTFFGLASYSGQCLEKGLVNFAMAYQLLESSALTQDEWLELYNSLNKRTFGQLFKSVKKRAEVPEPLLSNLDRALIKRNWLAHDFFYDRAVHLTDHDGLVTMIQELRELTELFQVTDRMIDSVCKDVWHSFGVTEDWVDREIEKQAEEYHATKYA